ncbi:MAG: 5-histidylcysteine sulfoxide synthase [Proteobacteria bacterium]|nr:5-histidylcysteine sulfoxide synthase [Pseudomonadota bacterium]
MPQSLSPKQQSNPQAQSTPRPISLAGTDVRSKRQELLAYFVATWEQYESLFLPLHENAYYLRAERLRHPLIFYFGHTATFYINKMMLAKFTDSRVNPAFEALFAIGVDEMSWDDLDESHYSWPTVAEVRAYRDKVKARIIGLIKSMPLELPITANCPAWLVLMGIEHERIHLETSSVIMRLLPLDMIDAARAEGWPACTESGLPPAVQWLPLGAATVTLGKTADDQTYGWDNEYGNEEQAVSEFKVATTLTSNQDFMQFVEAGGYKMRKYWTPEGKQWLAFTQARHPHFWRTTLNGKFVQRNLFSEMPLPLDWPVEVNYLEAKAYCNWQAETSGLPVRLPTEAEWHVIRNSQLDVETDVSNECVWQQATGNINLEQYASSCPVTANPQGNLYDITGNVWQWTETAIDGYPGFEVHPWYDDFSTPTFDGKHNLIKGGSWISTGNETLASSRYAFRRHFFQHAGFRMVISDSTLDFQEQDNVYETDALVAQYCEFHYGSEYFSVNNFPSACIASLMSHVRDKNIETAKVLDLGCAVGRSSFELAKHFQHVDAVDFSARFIQQGVKLQTSNRLRYVLPLEGDIVEYREVLLDQLGYDEVKDNIQFLQGDACNLKPQLTGYNLVFAGNLIDRLYDPMLFLNTITPRILPGGLLVLTSPYTWLEEYTDKDNWLGGIKVNGENFTTLDALKQQLGEAFEFEEALDIPFVIRETARKFQHTLAQMTIWRKR